MPGLHEETLGDNIPPSSSQWDLQAPALTIFHTDFALSESSTWKHCLVA